MRNDLHVSGIQLKKRPSLEKKALNNLHRFVLIDVKTERSTRSTWRKKNVFCS